MRDIEGHERRSMHGWMDRQDRRYLGLRQRYIRRVQVTWFLALSRQLRSTGKACASEECEQCQHDTHA